MQLLQRITLGILCLCCTYCAPSTPPAPAAAPDPVPAAVLKTAFAEDFRVGAALAPKHIDNVGMRGKNLLMREYNTITPENIMKWEVINPEAEVFNWTEPDLFVQFGEDNDMFIVGHALVWHSQLSDYVKEITEPEVMRAALKAHIEAVAGRYKGRINAWDVVNEALNEDGTMRESVFYKVLGEDYMTEAFNMAAAAAGPETELYYNDYNMWNADKRDGAIRMLNRMRTNGARIDGVGMQAHYSIVGPSIDTIEQAIEAYAAAGYKVMMTELDVTVLPNPWDLEGAEVSQDFENSPFMNPFPESLPDSMQTVLADRYEDLFKLYLKHADKINRVTFWGVNDGHSWLNGWPIKDRTNYPLLFDREYVPKPAYDRVMSLKNK
jgi:endo-1,4-beta-xylanase